MKETNQRWKNSIPCLYSLFTSTYSPHKHTHIYQQETRVESI